MTISAIDALGGFERFPRWMWRNEDVALFVDWLRAYNADVPLLQRTAASTASISTRSTRRCTAVLALPRGQRSATAATRARERYACFDHIDAIRSSTACRRTSASARKCETEVVAQLVEMQRPQARALRPLAEPATRGSTPSSRPMSCATPRRTTARCSAASTRRGTCATRTWPTPSTCSPSTSATVTIARPAKLVIWAHNSHVGDARATEIADAGQITLGQLIRAAPPGRDRARRLHDAQRLRDRRRTTGTSLPARSACDPRSTGSWEELFHDTGVPRFYVTAARSRACRRRRTRAGCSGAIGVVYRPETERHSHYLHARLADEFDVVIHIDSTRGLEPLDDVDLPDDEAAHTAHELPETYPSGI